MDALAWALAGTFIIPGLLWKFGASALELGITHVLLASLGVRLLFTAAATAERPRDTVLVASIGTLIGALTDQLLLLSGGGHPSLAVWVAGPAFTGRPASTWRPLIIPGLDALLYAVVSWNVHQFVHRFLWRSIRRR